MGKENAVCAICPFPNKTTHHIHTGGSRMSISLSTIAACSNALLSPFGVRQLTLTKSNSFLHLEPKIPKLLQFAFGMRPNLSESFLGNQSKNTNNLSPHKHWSQLAFHRRIKLRKVSKSWS